MSDNVLETKKEMGRIIRSKGLSRFEKYTLVRDKSNTLTEDEKKILLQECQRDYKFYKEEQDIKDIITISLTGIGLLIALLGVFFEEKVTPYVTANPLMIYVGVAVVSYIGLLILYQNIKNKRITVTLYMIDILEDE